MESTTTIGTHGPARAGDGHLMDIRLPVLAPTHLPIRGTTVRTGDAVCTDGADGQSSAASPFDVRIKGGVRLMPAYRATDVHSSASGGPPV